MDYLLQNELAIRSMSPGGSPSLLVTKEDGGIRFCTNYRKVNAVTVSDAYPLPRINDLIDSKHVFKIDLLKGYYQVSLTPRAQQISAFVTPFGLYQCNVMALGMKTAPSTFQRLVNSVIHGLEGTFAYIDDSSWWVRLVIRIDAG